MELVRLPLLRLLFRKGWTIVNADLIAKTIQEKAGGLNTQDIAKQEAAKIFYEKAAKQESFVIETNLYDVGAFRFGPYVSYYFTFLKTALSMNTNLQYFLCRPNLLEPPFLSNNLFN